MGDVILENPKGARALLVLAHGAGAGMHHPAMTALAHALNARKIATLRWEFPYMAAGKKRPDPPNVAVAAVARAVERAGGGKLPVFAGGRSFGGRMTTTAAAFGKLPGVRGIICFGFPLHPPKKPGTERAAHLADVAQPTLFIQGTRDDLAELGLMRGVVKKHRAISLHVVDGADHGFHVLKRSGRTDEAALAEVADAAATFVTAVLAK